MEVYNYCKQLTSCKKEQPGHVRLHLEIVQVGEIGAERLQVGMLIEADYCNLTDLGKGASYVAILIFIILYGKFTLFKHVAEKSLVIE